MSLQSAAEMIVQSQLKPSDAAGASDRFLAWHQWGEFAAVLFTDTRSDGDAAYRCITLRAGGATWTATDEWHDWFSNRGASRWGMSEGPPIQVLDHRTEQEEERFTFTMVFRAAREVEGVEVAGHSDRPAEVHAASGAGVVVIEATSPLRRLALRPLLIDGAAPVQFVEI